MNSGEFVRWLGGLPNLVGSYNYLLSSYIELIKIAIVFSKEYIQCYCHFSFQTLFPHRLCFVDYLCGRSWSLFISLSSLVAASLVSELASDSGGH